MVYFGTISRLAKIGIGKLKNYNTGLRILLSIVMIIIVVTGMFYIPFLSAYIDTVLLVIILITVIFLPNKLPKWSYTNPSIL